MTTQYHHNSYMYHTPKLDNDIRSLNVLFWNNAFKEDGKYLDDFCFRNNIDQHCKELLRSFKKEHIGILINPISIDFDIIFSRPIGQIVNVDFEALHSNAADHNATQNINKNELDCNGNTNNEEALHYKINIDEHIHNLSKHYSQNPLDETKYLNFIEHEQNLEMPFFSYEQFRKFLLLQTIKAVLLEYPLELFRLGISLEDARNIATLTSGGLITLVKSKDFTIKLKYNNEQLEHYLSEIIRMVDYGTYRTAPMVWDWLFLLNKILLLKLDDWKDLSTILQEDSKDAAFYLTVFEDLDQDLIPDVRKRHKRRLTTKLQEQRNKAKTFVYTPTNEHTRISFEHEDRIRLYLLNGISRLNTECDGKASNKIVRRIAGDLEKEYPEWRKNYEDHFRDLVNSHYSSSYKLLPLHKNFIANCYIKMRSLNRGFKFNRLEYVVVLYHYYMLLVDQYRLDPKVTMVFRIGIKDIFKTVVEVDLGDGELCSCGKCHLVYYRSSGERFRCPYCDLKRKLLED